MTFPNPIRAAGALLRLIRALFRRAPLLAPDEIEVERWGTCEACEAYDAESKQCLECTCFLQLKIPLLHEKCPKKKWRR